MRLKHWHAMQNGHMPNGHQVNADRTDGSSTSNVRPLPSLNIVLDYQADLVPAVWLMLMLSFHTAGSCARVTLQADGMPDCRALMRGMSALRPA